jgi:D-alanine-D-alanine ligase
MKILLITGGDSSEREVSLLSASEVKRALLKNNYKVTVYDLRDGYEPIKSLSKTFDVLFPVLHGEEGEGGKLHKFLSKLDKLIVGSRNYQGFEKAWHKIPFKTYCDKNKILTPPWRIVKKPGDIIKFGFPCVVKTSSGGSSREVFILIDKLKLHKYEKKIFKYNDLFVEGYIQGKEITVGILNDKALPVIEIIPPKDSWFDYKNKYSGATQEIIDSPSLSVESKKSVQNIALRIHKFFNLGSYSRIDFMFDKNDVPYVLEVNTIPGLTSQSLLPKETGIPFEKFVQVLVTSAK